MNGSFLIPAGVIGPASSTANAIATFSGTTGQFLLNNSVTISAGSITATQAILTGALNAVNVAAGVTPFVEFEVDSTVTTSPRGIMTAQFNTGTDGARLHMRKARGTRASPLVVVTGDNLGRIVGTGYDGANYLEMGSIIFATEGTIAATRVPTNIQFWTATDAAPSVLTQALILKSDQSATFAKNITFGTSASILNGTTGSIGLTATGTNQSITLTPSGTGQVTSTNTTGSAIITLTQSSGVADFGAKFVATNNLGNTASFVSWSNGHAGAFGNYAQIIGGGTAGIVLGGSGNQPIIFAQGGDIEKARFAGTTGNLLLGGLTTDGTGVLQFPAASTTTAGGITWASGVSLYPGSTTQLTIQPSAGTAAALRIADSSSTGVAQFRVSAGNGILESNGSLSLASNGTTTALTLNSSQQVIVASGGSAGAPGLVLTNSGDATTGFYNNFGGGIIGLTFAGTGGGYISRTQAAGGIGFTLVGQPSTFVFGTQSAWANTSGTKAFFEIDPTYNQASGTAANTDFLINRTQTAVGSGAQLLADFQVGGTSKFNIDNTGVVTMTGSLNSSANIVAGASSGIRWTASSYMAAPSNGIITLLNSANNDFTRLQFGGTTSSFPALARSATTLTVQLADGTAGGNLGLGGTITTYNNIATAGNGVVSVQGAARATAQTGANASVATYTVGASDASFEVSANILVTTATTHAFTCTCAYTDEGNTARTITFTFSNVGGTLLTSIANTGGTVPYEGVPLHIRAKASTSITIATTGTFTSVVYNVEGNIRKIA